MFVMHLQKCSGEGVNQSYWVCVEIIHQIILMVPNTWLSHMFIVWEIVVLLPKTCWFEWRYDSMWLSELSYWVVSQKLFEIVFIFKRKWYYDYCLVRDFEQKQGYRKLATQEKLRCIQMYPVHEITCFMQWNNQDTPYCFLCYILLFVTVDAHKLHNAAQVFIILSIVISLLSFSIVTRIVTCSIVDFCFN